MPDRIQITIDCDRGEVDITADMTTVRQFNTKIRTSKAELIAKLLMPRIVEMMNVSVEALTEAHLKTFKE